MNDDIGPEHYQRFFSSAVDLLCIANTEGILLAANPAWTRVLGWSPEELYGRAYIDFVHPDDVAATIEATKALGRGEVIIQFVNRFRAKSGGYRRLEWCSRVPPGDDLIFASTRDITDAIRESAHLAEIEAVSQVGSWEIDLDSHTVFWSPLTHAIHETHPATHRPFLEDALQFFPPRACETLRPAVQKLMDEGIGYDLELPFVTATGRERWVRTTAAAEFHGGRVSRAFGTLQDITDRRATALAQRERLEQLLSACPATVYAICHRFAAPEYWHFLYLSGNCAELLGVGPAQILDQDSWWYNHIHADDRATVVATTTEWLASGARDLLRQTYRVQRPDGTCLWIEDTLRARHNTTGAIVELVGSFIDVSERKSQELAAALTYNRLQATLDAIPDMLFELDWDGRFLSYHSGPDDLLATPPEQFLGRLLEDVMPPEVAALSRNAIAEVERHGRASGYRYSLDLPNGRRWFELSGARNTNVHPGTTCVFLSRDITDRQTAQVELQEALDRAELANSAKSRLLANMSHEIRTPLNGVIGMADVLSRTLTDPAQQRMLRVILDSGQVTLNIINDILDISKIEAGKLEVEAIPFKPIELARKLEALHSLKAAEKPIALTVLTTVYAETPRRGDPNRILQILHNLLSNAIKFTEQGEVTVIFRCNPSQPLRLEVRDTGIGMTPDQLSRIFEDFEQADTSISRRFGGTGLGMSIARRLVKLMGGELHVESEVGVGTSVRLELPLATSEDAVPPAPPPVEPRLQQLRGIRVLAADDNEINRLVLEAMLTKIGAQTTMVQGGAAAIEATRNATFDVMLLDIAMPDIDGIMALLRIRAHETKLGRSPTPAIAFTANAMTWQVDSYLAAGFATHIAKPLRRNNLVEVLLQVLYPAPQTLREPQI